jgi:hypothetical protein
MVPALLQEANKKIEAQHKAFTQTNHDTKPFSHEFK